MSEVRVVKDRSGSGEVIAVQVVNQSRWVAVWTWAAFIDGPMHEDAQQLVDAIANWSGGYQDVSASLELPSEL